jgi:flagellar L-ring protein precursor FlgH
MKRAQILIGCTLLVVISGCATKPNEIGQEPRLSEMGKSLTSEQLQLTALYRNANAEANGSTTWDDSKGFLFRDFKARTQGDVLTIDISIDDKASLGNQSNRSKEASVNNSLDYLIKFLGLGTSGSGSLDINSSSASAGKGNVQRSEKIKFSLAAIVTKTLPNGLLLVSGSQETRVNFELRILTIQGLVKPQDITKDNRVSFDKIAEARVSYGGRGRLTEVQQPQIGQQVYDIIRPF